MTTAVIVAIAEAAGATAAEAAFVAAVVQVVVVVATAYASQEAQRKAQNEAKDAYNASLRDRYVMTRGAIEPRQIVLGRARVSGPMFYVGSYGTSREHLVFTVALAAHEIDAIEAIYFDDNLVTLDGSGNVLGVTLKETFNISSTGAVFTINEAAVSGTVVATAIYGTSTVSLGVAVVGTAVTVSGATGAVGLCEIRYRPVVSQYVPNPTLTASDTIVINASGNGSVTLAHSPIAAAFSVVDGTGIVQNDLTAYTSVAGSVLTITASPIVSITASVSYQWIDTSSKARVRSYLGAAGQTADAAMISALPGIWTSAHTATGVAYLVVELDYDPTAFPAGIPNVSALIRGAKVYDPRTGATAWSDNLALMIRHYATSPIGGRQSTALMSDASFITAANVCDTSTNYVLNGRTYTRSLYRGGTVAKSTARPQDVINDLTAAMAGKWTFVDGLMRVKAGSYTTPVMTLDETWLHEAQQVHVQPKRARTDIINVVTGTFADETINYQVAQIPRVAPSAYITEDGVELPLNLTMQAVQFNAQAQHIAGVMLRDSRASIQLTVLCNMKAYPLELFDVIYVTLSRFGWVAKTFEVLDISWTLSGGIQLVLKETDATVTAVSSSFTAFDPAKATRLPSPFKVADIAGLAVVSGATSMVTNSDGTVVQRMNATWTATTDPGILDGSGGIEVRFGLATQNEALWTSVMCTGNQTQTYLNGVQFDKIYMVKVRGYNFVSTGKWSNAVLHKVTGVSIAVDTGGLVPNAATNVYTNVASTPLTFSTTNVQNPITFSFPSAGTYELTVTSQVICTAFTSVDKLNVWFSMSGAGTNVGHGNPTYSVTSNGQYFMVSQTLTVIETGSGPWQCNLNLSLVNGTCTVEVHTLVMRSTYIKR